MLKFLSPLHRSTRQISVWFESHMSGVGVSPQEGHLLSYLRSYEPCPIAELVKVFGLKSSTMTSLLDRLEARGQIERIPNPDDRRSLLVRLTRAGRRTAEQVQRLVEEIEGEIGSRIRESDRRGFDAVMGAIDAATNVKLRDR